MRLELFRHVADPLDDQDNQEWLRVAFIGKKDTVYVPAALCSDCEHSVFEKVHRDGVAFIDGEHLYVEVEWAKSVYPHHASLLDNIQQSVTRIHRMRRVAKTKVDAKKYDIQ